ncbi:hypothetical protein L3X38_038220 [Prunus dulcis]|uniref:F-box domain-containing protein n=2 Tax=Prunus dulcis TaxID=3755 RepID=A0AAD4V704_PRUDU|nr:hypothetical protein L3X38_038220 [Prunus dulcis]
MEKKRPRPTSQFLQYQGGYNNLRKRKRSKHGHNKLLDRISELPDAILVSILSLLPLKEAHATGVLSRRWRYVWASTMILNFEAEKALCSLLDLEPEAEELEVPCYVDWVNVNSIEAQSWSNLGVVFDLDDKFQVPLINGFNFQ